MNIRGRFSEFLTDERSAHAIECGLLAVGILVACIAAAAAFGAALDVSPDHAAKTLN
jgi:Flp pilus assembly pilin Flp